MSSKESFEKVYEKPGAVWTREMPSKELAESIARIMPCKAIDIGCGEGFNSIFLAKKGFDVTGVDFSEKAISYAKENAAKHGVKIRFIVMSAFDLDQLKEKFGFVLEWGVMHHIMPEKREKYVKDVDNLLNNQGKYLSVCFNDQSPEFGAPGEKIREGGSTRNVLHYSSQDELKELFKPYFHIIESKIIKMSGGKGALSHIGNYFFMEKL